MSKQTNSQFLIDSVRKLDKINDIDFQLQGRIEDVLENPTEWAEAQAELYISRFLSNYLEAKALGKEFWDEISNQD